MIIILNFYRWQWKCVYNVEPELFTHLIANNPCKIHEINFKILHQHLGTAT